MNFEYEVVVTPNAQEEFDQFILYLLLEKKNEQAVRNVLLDFKQTKDVLSRVAESIQYCEDEDLRKRGYRRINFQKHRYFMLYRVVGKQVIIDDIFHELQDLRKWMN